MGMKVLIPLLIQFLALAASQMASPSYRLIANGTCIHSNGNALSYCYNRSVYSLSDCEAFCTASNSCVGYIYGYNSCSLIPSSQSFSTCEPGYTFSGGSDKSLANTSDDLVGFTVEFPHPAHSFQCYAKNEGYEYPSGSGISWYLGDVGDSCDTTCSNLKLSNNAVGAMSAVNSGDCSVLQHLISANNLGPSIITPLPTSYWTFGHFYTDSQKYYCTNYGTGDAAVNVGQTSIGPTRRLVCSCLAITSTTETTTSTSTTTTTRTTTTPTTTSHPTMTTTTTTTTQPTTTATTTTTTTKIPTACRNKGRKFCKKNKNRCDDDKIQNRCPVTCNICCSDFWRTQRCQIVAITGRCLYSKQSSNCKKTCSIC